MAQTKAQRRKAPPPSSAEVRPAPAYASPSSPFRQRGALVTALCALIVLTTCVAYRWVLGNGFVLLDDNLYITDNPQVQKGLAWESIRWAFTTFHAANWHPVTWLSHMTDVQLFGLDAGRHHLTSLLLHCANAVLLLLLLFRMTGALWRSALVAALFALHPLHVESVAWIAERKDVLSTLFWLLTLFAWLAYVRSKKAGPYLLASALFALGLMAKPMLVTLPFTLLLLDFWPLGRLGLPLRGRWPEVKRLLWEKAPLFALAAASSVVTILAQGKAGAVSTIDQISPAARLLNAGNACMAYLVKMVWPSSLAVFYPHPRSAVLTGAAAAAILTLAGITVLAYRLRRRAPYVIFGWLWYLGTLVPVLGVVQVGRQSMADRYTYVPLIGVFIATAWGLAELAGDHRVARRLAAAASAAALAALLAVSHAQTLHWADDETLFTHVLAVTPENDMAHFHLGNIRLAQGRLDEAITHLQEAIRIDPRVAESYNSLALAWLRQGRIEQGLALLREAYRLDPSNIRARRNLSVALLKTAMGLAGRKDFTEAAPLFEEASSLLEALPPDCLMQWGIALLKLNRFGEAADRFRGVLANDPESGEAHFQLGFALSQLQRHAEAIPHYRRAYGKPGIVSESILWIGEVYRKGGLCDEAVQVYRIIPPSDPAYAASIAGISACGGKP